jgi:transcriptional regulator with XRE-family HTH domain
MSAHQSKNLFRANRVRELRKAQALSQDHLARLADVDIRTIQRLERGEPTSAETLMAIAAVLKTDIKRLSASLVAEDAPVPKHTDLLPKLTSGKEFSDIALGTDHFQFHHDEDTDPRSVRAMKGVLEFLKQDLVRLHDAALKERLNVEGELSIALRGIETWGYHLFGIRRVIRRRAEGRSTLISMATFYLSHSRSAKLIKDGAYMVVPAALTQESN